MSSIPDNKWDRVFSTNREFREDWSRAYVDRFRDIDADCDGIEIFLQEYEDFGLEDKVEELKAFVGEVTLRDLEQGVGAAGLCNRAWLDERCITGERRDHKNPFTAAQLYKRRQTPRVGAKNTPNSDRCLTYIRNFDALYMMALVETALPYEVRFLREAIWQHYARQISLKVTIPYRGYKIFQLQFHLQFFRFATGSANDHGIAAKDPRYWTDLSFLATPGKRCGMTNEHFSFVIYGDRENRWAGYAFDDTKSDGDDLQDKIYCEGLHVDPICSGGLDDVDSELPIWDPREYFLNVVTTRVGLAADSWEALLRAIERRVKHYIEQYPSTLSDGKREDVETVKTFDWTRQTIELVNTLRGALSETNQQWDLFNVQNGDAGYFSDGSLTSSSTDVALKSNYSIPGDNSQHRLKPLLCEIREHYQRLQTVQRKFDALSASCKDSAKALELRLSLESNRDTQLQLRLALESNETMKESNKAMKTSSASTDFQIFILAPILVAAACLQYAPSLIPLPPMPAVVVLTGIFIVVIKLLHAIFRRLPEVGWCWSTIKASVKAMRLKNAGDPCIGDTSSSSEHRQSINIGRTAIDVEKGTFLG